MKSNSPSSKKTPSMPFQCTEREWNRTKGQLDCLESFRRGQQQHSVNNSILQVREDHSNQEQRNGWTNSNNHSRFLSQSESTSRMTLRSINGSALWKRLGNPIRARLITTGRAHRVENRFSNRAKWISWKEWSYSTSSNACSSTSTQCMRITPKKYPSRARCCSSKTIRLTCFLHSAHYSQLRIIIPHWSYRINDRLVQAWLSWIILQRKI